MIGHTDGSVLNDDSERPGSGSRTPAVRGRGAQVGADGQGMQGSR